VCYSHSYREPVLYFQATEPSGTPLSFSRIKKELEQQEDGISLNFSHFIDNEIMRDVPSISQEDHPVLHSPFYMLHPCQTGEIMTLLSGFTEQDMGEQQNLKGKHPPPQPLVPHGGVYSNLGISSSIKYLLSWLCVAGRPLEVAPSVSEFKRAIIKLAAAAAG
jgi:Autophagocytosis associated protein, active-site domain